MSLENYVKLVANVTELTNQLTKVDETLKKMESQLAVCKSVSVAFENSVVSLERHCWQNEQRSLGECINSIGIPDTTNENKVCD